MHWNMIWKSLGFVPFGANLTHFGAKGAKCTEIWSEKAPDLSHLGPIWPTLEPNLPSLVSVETQRRARSVWQSVTITTNVRLSCRPKCHQLLVYTSRVSSGTMLGQIVSKSTLFSHILVRIRSDHVVSTFGLSDVFIFALRRSNIVYLDNVITGVCLSVCMYVCLGHVFQLELFWYIVPNEVIQKRR